jgi:dihydroxyacetone kinase-like predicted kinase
MPDADAKTNEEAMLEEIKNVKTGQVTYAVRDTHIDDKEIHEGDIMGIGDSGILAVGKDLEETTKELIANLVDEDSELISIYYGEEVGLSGLNNYPYQTNRYDMDFSKATKDNVTYQHYKNLLSIRNAYTDVFARGSRNVVASSDEEG